MPWPGPHRMFAMWILELASPIAIQSSPVIADAIEELILSPN